VSIGSVECRAADRFKGCALLALHWRVSTEPPDGDNRERARIEPSATPRTTWDFVPLEGGDTKSYPVIYKLEGDTFTMCSYTGHVGDPPQTFDPPKPGDPQIPDVYKRMNF
jgi:uncharacterized protein (TIGR03067 family)